MNELKPGDKVRCINDEMSAGILRIGHVYAVATICNCKTCVEYGYRLIILVGINGSYIPSRFVKLSSGVDYSKITREIIGR